jgi:hypothetical protein
VVCVIFGVPGKFVLKRSSLLTNSVHSCANTGTDTNDANSAQAITRM